MSKKTIIENTRDFVKNKLAGEGSGHDWWHIVRVTVSALVIAKKEKADLFVVELAALLHDIADHKFYNGDDTVGPKVAREWLEGQGTDPVITDHVINIISNMSFSKNIGKKVVFTSKELQVVQDADRLDAIGAIGIARVFAYGGHKGREIFNPTIKPLKYKTAEEYKKNDNPTVNHFYEKLLLLKDLMNTKAGKQIAQKRHKYMEQYLKQFFAEWEGKA